MGILDKVKNLFTEEVEEEPVKSEVIQVEIPAPVKKEEVVTDSEVLKQEEKPAAPIFFDDEYFKELEQPKQPKQEVKSSYLKEKKEENKRFQPSPVISPVYGVLEKNYKKEDITEKKDKYTENSNSSVTIDDVRKKAFGTLEDDIETTLFGSNSILFNDDETKEEKIDITRDLFDELTEESKIDDKKEEQINIVEEEMENNLDELKNEIPSDGELFDLIDSMYEKGKE